MSTRIEKFSETSVVFDGTMKREFPLKKKSPFSAMAPCADSLLFCSQIFQQKKKKNKILDVVY